MKRPWKGAEWSGRGAVALSGGFVLLLLFGAFRAAGGNERDVAASLREAYVRSLPVEVVYEFSGGRGRPAHEFSVFADRSRALLSVDGTPVYFLDGLDAVNLAVLSRFPGSRVRAQAGLFTEVFSERFKKDFGREPDVPKRVWNSFGLVIPFIRSGTPVPSFTLEPVVAGGEAGLTEVGPLWLVDGALGGEWTVRGDGSVEVSGDGWTAVVGADGWLLEALYTRGGAEVSLKRKAVRKPPGMEKVPAPREALFAEDMSVAEPEIPLAASLGLAIRTVLAAAGRRGAGSSSGEDKEKFLAACRSGFEALLAEYSVDFVAEKAALAVVRFLKEKAPDLEGRSGKVVAETIEVLLKEEVGKAGRGLSAEALGAADSSWGALAGEASGGTSLMRLVLEALADAFAATAGDRIGRAVRRRLRKFVVPPVPAAEGARRAG